MRNRAESMARYLMYDKDKNGELDEQEARAALTTLGIDHKQQQVPFCDGSVRHSGEKRARVCVALPSGFPGLRVQG
jgi:hypothetical protein